MRQSDKILPKPWESATTLSPSTNQGSVLPQWDVGKLENATFKQLCRCAARGVNQGGQRDEKEEVLEAHQSDDES